MPVYDELSTFISNDVPLAGIKVLIVGRMNHSMTVPHHVLVERAIILPASHAVCGLPWAVALHNEFARFRLRRLCQLLDQVRQLDAD